MVDVLEQQDLYDLERKVDDLAEKIEYIINHLCRPEYEHIVYYSAWHSSNRHKYLFRFEDEGLAFKWLKDQFTPTGQKIKKDSWLFKNGWENQSPSNFKVKEVMKNYYTDIPYWIELSIKDE